MSGSELTVDHVGLAPDHALIVLRGVLDTATVAQLGTGVELMLDTGARYLVADLAEVTSCDPAALPVLAGAARRCRHDGGGCGWSRSAPPSSPPWRPSTSST